jgi:hypothetical protein
VLKQGLDLFKQKFHAQSDSGPGSSKHGEHGERTEAKEHDWVVVSKDDKPAGKDSKGDAKVDWKHALGGFSMPFLSKGQSGGKASSQPNIAEFKGLVAPNKDKGERR